MEKIAIYPGSFDPLTLGHLDIIERGLKVFDKLIIAVAINTDKVPSFTLEERVLLIKESLASYPNVEVDHFEGLLVEYARSRGAHALLRGLRAVADFEFELHMANMNRNLAPELETFFIMTAENYFFVSSKTIREVAYFGGNVDNLVPEAVARALEEKYQAKRK